MTAITLKWWERVTCPNRL